MNKIPCLAVIYFDPDTVQKFLTFITKWSDKLDITIVENPSDMTAAFQPVIQELLKNGSIKNYFLFHRNIRNNVVDAVLASGKFDMNHRYVLITDGDVITDDDFLSEQLRIMDNSPEAFVCSVNLDMSNLPLKAFPEAVNWVPPLLSENDLYKEGYGGGHLMMMRAAELPAFIEYKQARSWTWTDGSIRQYAYANGKKWAKTKHSIARHLTWDTYADRNHPYTQLKMAKSPSELWDVLETCKFDFLLTLAPVIR